jgi:hypothetical protein
VEIEEKPPQRHREEKPPQRHRGHRGKTETEIRKLEIKGSLSEKSYVLRESLLDEFLSAQFLSLYFLCALCVSVVNPLLLHLHSSSVVLRKFM